MVLIRLQFADRDLKEYGSMLVGMEFVAREIRFYTIFEVVYLKKPSEATEQLSNTLAKTYAKLLQYLANAMKYYKGNFLSTRIINDYPG